MTSSRFYSGCYFAQLVRFVWFVLKIAILSPEKGILLVPAAYFLIYFVVYSPNSGYLFWSAQRFSVILLHLSHACSMPCVSRVCEGAQDGCSCALSARGFRKRKPREHTYIYKKSVNAALSLVRWNLRNFKIWTMMNARGDAYGYAINVCQSVRGGYNFLFYIPSTLLVHTSIHTAWVLLYSSFKSGFLRASTTDG